MHTLTSDSRSEAAAGDQRGGAPEGGQEQNEGKPLRNRMLIPEMRKCGKAPDAKIPDRVGRGGRERGGGLVRELFTLGSVFPGTKGSVIFNAWPPVYLIRLHHYFCYQGNTQLNGGFFFFFAGSVSVLVPERVRVLSPQRLPDYHIPSC